MGLLYEYSKPDETVYIERKPAPAQVANLREETPPQPIASTTIPFDGKDMGLSVVIVLAIFFTTMFVALMIFSFYLVFNNPQILDSSDPTTAARTLMEPFETAYGLQFFFASSLLSIALLAGFSFVARRAKRNWALLGLQQMDSSQVQYAILAGVVIALGITGGTILTAFTQDGTEQLSIAIENLLADTPTLISMLIVLIAIVLLPLAEELYFRGVIYAWLRRRGRLVGAMIVSGIIYGIFNLNPIGFLPSVGVGIGLALVYERTGSLWGAYIAHSTFNFASIVIYVAIVIFN